MYIESNKSENISNAVFDFFTENPMPNINRKEKFCDSTSNILEK